MSQSQSERAVTPATLRESSVDDQSNKRGEAAAGLSGRNSPAKKQRLEQAVPLPFPNLSTIFVVGKRRSDGQTLEVALDAFSDPTLHGTELRPSQFQYTKFRDWALDVLEIPREESIRFKLVSDTQGIGTFPIATKYDFINALTKIWNGTLRTQFKRDRGESIVISKPVAAVPDPPQPVEEVKQPEKPEPEKPEPKAPEKPEPEKPETEQPLEEPRKDPETKPKPEPEPEEPQPDPKSPEVIDLTVEDKVLPADAFLQLVRDAETPEDDSLAPGVPESPDADEKLYGFDIRTLKKALVFWNTNIGEDEKCEVRGMNIRLHIWQIHGGYLMFRNVSRAGCNGLLIGLDVGFGKTILVLLYVLGKAAIWALEYEVRAEWKSNIPKNHLARNEKGRCPTQHKHMVQCPCSWTTTERRILKFVADLPSLIICPPNLRDTWLTEAKKTFKGFGEEDFPLTFYYYFGQDTKGNDFRNKSGLKKFLQATKGVTFIEGETEWVNVGNGRATDLFFTSNMQTEKLIKCYQVAGVPAAFGTFIMDEMQKYRGSSTSKSKAESESGATIPLKAMNSITDDSYNPPNMFALCGTIAEEGYTFWDPLIKYFKMQWEMYAIDLKTVAEYPVFLDSSERITKAYKELIRQCAEDPTPTEDKKAMAAEIRRFLKPITFAIRQNEMWRDKVLNPLPPTDQKTVPVAPLANEAVKKALLNIMSNVEKLVKDELVRKVKEWNKKKTRAEREGWLKKFEEEEKEPTRDDVIEHQVGAETPKKAWLELSRACSFPYLATLDYSSEALESGTVQAEPVAIAKEMDKDPKRLHADEKEFENWEFYRHREGLRANSPKLAELEQGLIPELINDEDPETEPDKEDPCRKRYAIVFCNNNVTTVMIWFFLITNKELCKKIQPILFTSAVSIERRQQIAREFVEPGEADGRCKILIATIGIAAEGLNLQRANNVWYIEIPGNPSKWHQSMGRVCRTGQKAKVKVVRLLDPTNLFERTSKNTLDGKLLASRLIYNATEP